MLLAATSLATLRKVEDNSTFLANCNATFLLHYKLRKWGGTQAIVFATCDATFAAKQVAGKIASCNMTFGELFSVHIVLTNSVDQMSNSSVKILWLFTSNLHTVISFEDYLVSM